MRLFITWIAGYESIGITALSKDFWPASNSDTGLFSPTLWNSVKVIMHTIFIMRIEGCWR